MELGPVASGLSGRRLLVLDDLGAVKPTEWVWDTVSVILNTRYNESNT